jgi:hypothetical protein
MGIVQMHFTYGGGQPITLALEIDRSWRNTCAVALGTSSAPNEIAGEMINGLDQSPQEVIREIRRALDQLERSFAPS